MPFSGASTVQGEPHSPGAEPLRHHVLRSSSKAVALGAGRVPAARGRGDAFWRCHLQMNDKIALSLSVLCHDFG